MRVHPARAAPPLAPDGRIAPHQLWSHLSISQQQHVRTGADRRRATVAGPSAEPTPN